MGQVKSGSRAHKTDYEKKNAIENWQFPLAYAVDAGSRLFRDYFINYANQYIS